jgi:hypothetical protein
LESFPADLEMGGGHAHAGGMIYLGDSWPSKYRGNIFMFNLHGHRVNMDRLERQGSGYLGKHDADLLQMNDAWSLGLNLQYGPDGGAYMIDFYEKNICHTTKPDFYDRSNGRIYKISYEAGKTNRMPVTAGTTISMNLAQMSDEQLIALQLHPNDWFVRHARRILQERYGNSMALGTQISVGRFPMLKAKVHASLAGMVREHPDVTRKLRALWALSVTGGFKDELGRELLKHDNEFIRAWAIQFLAEERNPSLATLKEFAPRP